MGNSTNKEKSNDETIAEFYGDDLKEVHEQLTKMGISITVAGCLFSKAPAPLCVAGLLLCALAERLKAVTDEYAAWNGVKEALIGFKGRCGRKSEFYMLLL